MAALATLATAAVAAGWLAGGPAAPPIYDGGLPAPPYRAYCNPPAGQPQAAGKRQTFPLQGGQSPAVSFTTDEPIVPQLQLLAAAGSFHVPAGATELVVEARPMPPPASLPADGALDGNVYSLSASAAGAPVSLSQPATVVIRGPAGGGDAVIERLAGQSWSRVDTQPVGQQDIWGGNVTELGTFALVRPGKPAPARPCSTQPGSGGNGPGPGAGAPPGSDGSGPGTAVIVLGAAGGVALIVAAGLLVLVRDRPVSAGRGGRRRR